LFKLSILFTLFTNKKLTALMKIGKPVIIIVIIISILGTIFHLQGKSIIGPESSFMYSNPEWITHGLQIIILGTVMITLGSVLRMIKKHS